MPNEHPNLPRIDIEPVIEINEFEDAEVPEQRTSADMRTERGMSGNFPQDVYQQEYGYVPTQPEHPAKTTSAFIMEHGGTLRKVAGALCIIVPIAVLVLGLYMAFSNNFPASTFDAPDPSGKYVAYSQERYDELMGKVSAADATMEEHSSDRLSDEYKAADREKDLAGQDLRSFRLHLLSKFLFSWALLPCLALFACWLVLAIKTKNNPYDPVPTKKIVVKSVLFVIGGCIFFNAVPGIVFDFVNNIMSIVAVVVTCVVGWFAIKHMGSGGAASSAPMTVNGGKTKVPKNTPAGAVMAHQEKYSGIGGRKDPAYNENLRGMKSGAKVKTVETYYKLRRAETAISGKYIGIADGNETHYVCSQYDYDHGNVVIVDQHGRVRKV